MATSSARNQGRLAPTFPDVTKDPRVQQALAKLGTSVNAITEEQVRITEIPAPPFHESVRGAYVSKLFADAGLDVHTDEEGNVIGVRPGLSPTILC